MEMESCVLCRRIDETTMTGALSCKGEVIAHQNCLLYASGIFCKESPEFDDLFGFSMEDVLQEAYRGAKLKCKKCRKNGATVGCEVKRCKKSYHFPCAIEDGATKMEDAVGGKYGIFCMRHSQKRQNKSLNGQSSSASSSHSSTNQSKCGSLKRRLSFDDEQEESPSKMKWKRIKETSSSDDTDTEMGLIAPIETDTEESQNYHLEQEVDRNVAESSARSPLGNHSQDRSADIINEEAIYSDAESESLLLPVHVCMDSQLFRDADCQTSPLTPCALVKVEAASLENDVNGFRSEQSTSQVSTKPSFPQPATSSSSQPNQSNPGSVGIFHQATRLTVSSLPPKTTQTPKPNMDSASFWKSCNVAGCTRAIFSDFFSGMNAAAERIEEDQASQEDYDLALSVLTASGKLLQFVATQQQAIQRKLTDLQSAASAMKDAVTSLQGQE
uniref:PHD-type domain-containing protein n=1 Tax=Gouania willdenowi TaxID=441366 RepID=A0A8C5EQR5_GOUWI